LHQPVDALDVHGAGGKRACRRRWRGQRRGGAGVLVERHEILVLGAESLAHLRRPFVHGARGRGILVDRGRDRAHSVLLNAAVVSGEQHRPFRKGHEQ